MSVGRYVEPKPGDKLTDREVIDLVLVQRWAGRAASSGVTAKRTLFVVDASSGLVVATPLAYVSTPTTGACMFEARVDYAIDYGTVDLTLGSLLASASPSRAADALKMFGTREAVAAALARSREVVALYRRRFDARTGYSVPRLLGWATATNPNPRRA